MKYQNAIVTFLDILGFSALVDGGTAPRKLNEILDRVEKEVSEDDVPVRSPLKTVCVSDCVIRVEPLKDAERVPLQKIGTEVYVLGIIQVRLLEEGLPVRGAITCGKVYVSQNRFFGPAYQEAFRLENQRTVYPRILVDEKLVGRVYDALMERELTDPSETQRDLEEVLSKDDDGVYFIDYLRIYEDACEDYADLVQFLLVHRDLIARRIREFAGNHDVVAKYWWMRRYHNRYVQSRTDTWLASVGCTRAELKVGED